MKLHLIFSAALVLLSTAPGAVSACSHMRSAKACHRAYGCRWNGSKCVSARERTVDTEDYGFDVEAVSPAVAVTVSLYFACVVFIRLVNLLFRLLAADLF